MIGVDALACSHFLPEPTCTHCTFMYFIYDWPILLTPNGHFAFKHQGDLSERAREEASAIEDLRPQNWPQVRTLDG